MRFPDKKCERDPNKIVSVKMSNSFKEFLMARNLSKKTIKQYIKHLKMFEREHQKISSHSINRFIKNHPTHVARAFLKYLFEYLSEQEGFEDYRFPKIPGIKGKHSKVERSLPKDQELSKIRKWLYNNKDYKYVIMFDISEQCALRREEVVTLTKYDFFIEDWEEGKGMKFKVYSKGRGRIVLMPPKTAKRLVKYFVENFDLIDERTRFFGVGEGRWSKVFQDAVRNSLSDGYKSEDEITLHDLRRRRATLWAKNLDLDEVRRRLGHASISTTQRYLLRNEEERINQWAEEF